MIKEKTRQEAKISHNINNFINITINCYLNKINIEEYKNLYKHNLEKRKIIIRKLNTIELRNNSREIQKITFLSPLSYDDACIFGEYYLRKRQYDKFKKKLNKEKEQYDEFINKFSKYYDFPLDDEFKENYDAIKKLIETNKLNFNKLNKAFNNLETCVNIILQHEKIIADDESLVKAWEDDFKKFKDIKNEYEEISESLISCKNLYSSVYIRSCDDLQNELNKKKGKFSFLRKAEIKKKKSEKEKILEKRKEIISNLYN